MTTRTCPACGTDVDRRFCPQCGTEVQPDAAATSAGTSQPPRRRLLFIALGAVVLVAAVVAVAVVVAAGSDGRQDSVAAPTPEAPTTGPPTASTAPSTATDDLMAEAIAAWPATAAGLSGPIVEGEIFTADGVPTQVTGEGQTQTPDGLPGEGLITIWTYTEGEWQQAVSYASQNRTTKIRSLDVTGDEIPDVIVEGVVNEFRSFVFSNHPGSWQLIPFADEPGFMVSIGPAEAGNGLVLSYRGCDPDCASGGRIEETWTYDPPSATFVAPSTSASPSEAGGEVPRVEGDVVDRDGYRWHYEVYLDEPKVYGFTPPGCPTTHPGPGRVNYPFALLWTNTGDRVGSPPGLIISTNISPDGSTVYPVTDDWPSMGYARLGSVETSARGYCVVIDGVPVGGDEVRPGMQTGFLGGLVNAPEQLPPGVQLIFEFGMRDAPTFTVPLS
ncbi:zinc ribbon domain-containing protein [Rhabdothermincola salaria]|uniref:zinc ribbon domain-containing protein n=1 Tax=Rhabdothermincola salaria TaxID=2903142 RepID=UPI001E454C6C|nr:zinc ribbon domain-containing protein [Rhabdothermincola salaria]MCD9624227.1 zinc ribbon domain-containing protein [Rhabdothermincola salaria]